MLAQVITLCEQARRRTEVWFDPRGLPDPRTGRPRYDPSGLVKGWAAERAARHLHELPGLGWCLNAGGDILVHTPDDQPAWRIGIENPDDPTRIMRVVENRTGAVATSGSAHRGTHIIDPHTRRPAIRTKAVTGRRSLPDVGRRVRHRGPDALQWLDGYEALLVARSGLLRATTGWPAA